jgi:hypothetical protein
MKRDSSSSAFRCTSDVRWLSVREVCAALGVIMVDDPDVDGLVAIINRWAYVPAPHTWQQLPAPPSGG